MKKSKKSPVVFAVVLICIGVALVITSLILTCFRLSDFSSLRFSDVSREVRASFDSIIVEEIDCNIRILPSGDDTCRIVSRELPHLFNTVTVEAGVLKIERRDERMWHERILVFGSADPTLTIYLPQAEYTELILQTASGSIQTDSAFRFERVTAKTVGGDITLSSAVSNRAVLSATSGNILAENQKTALLSLFSSSGSITLRNVTATEIKAATSSGKIRLEAGVKATVLEAESESGDIFLADVEITKALKALTHTGNVAMLNAEFAHAYIATDSGNVTGSLRTKKQLDVKTESGITLLPESGSGAICSVRTVSGNVSLSYVN